MISAKKLLPTKEEGRKLFLKVWEYLLLAFLGGLALLIPASRGWLYSRAKDLWLFARHDVLIPGWIVLVLSVASILAGFHTVRWGLLFVRPVHERRYTRGHFDGIDWTWRWKKGRVLKHSLVPFCPKCQTELHVTAKGNQYDGRDTVVYCTVCNDGFTIRNVADLRDHIYRKVEGNARVGSWRKHLEQSTRKA